jgi:hypothetical protein
MWSEFSIIKNCFLLEFDLLSSANKDNLLTLFTSTSSNSITFTGYPTSSSSYTTQITNDTIDLEEICDSSFTPYYTMSFTLEEE